VFLLTAAIAAIISAVDSNLLFMGCAISKILLQSDTRISTISACMRSVDGCPGY